MRVQEIRFLAEGTAQTKRHPRKVEQANATPCHMTASVKTRSPRMARHTTRDKKATTQSALNPPGTTMKMPVESAPISYWSPSSSKTGMRQERNTQPKNASAQRGPSVQNAALASLKYFDSANTWWRARFSGGWDRVCQCTYHGEKDCRKEEEDETLGGVSNGELGGIRGGIERRLEFKASRWEVG